MVSTTYLTSTITLFCLIGLGLSIYAYIVELKIENDKNYEAMCDISEHMSCTKAFKSEFGKGFGLVSKQSVFYKPNSLVGILFYSLLATLAQSNSVVITKISLVFVLFSNFMSIYLAYILYFKLHDFCVVCITTYVVNLLNLVFLYLKLRNLSPTIECRKKKE